MKRLLLLLIIPTLSYSQITYEDVMSINSEKTFKRVMIENGLEYDDSGDFGKHYIFYGLNIRKDSVEGNKSSLWGSYNKRNGEFKFKIVLWSGLFSDDDNLYDLLVEKIKKNCTFYDVLNQNGDDFVCYSCPQSMYKGKIGFTKIDGSGVIKHIIEKKPITFSDIMRINSPKTFNKIMNEKGYEFDESNDSTIYYGFNIGGDEDYLSSEWGVYNKNSDEFYFKYGYDDDYDDDFYDELINDIKKNCTFYDTLKNNGPNKRDYISYSCPQSTYKGKIGYTITDSVSLIKHIIPIEEELKN